MATTRPERLPDLREFIKEHDQRLFDFCLYMLHGGIQLEEMILAIFRDFGTNYRKVSSRRTAADYEDVKLELFRRAWIGIRDIIATSDFSWNVGRDTRPLKGSDEDLLRVWKSKDISRVEGSFLDRLSRVDPDFRAPVVLRDILQFGDEEVVRILGLRWGVYRHRLHRGRLDLKDYLRGRAVTTDAKGITLGLNPSTA